MLIKGSSETGYPFEELREYYLYHLVYDKNAIDKITRDFIPDDYEEFTKGAMSKSIQGKDYGKDIDEISVLLICRQGASEFKVRKRLCITNSRINTLGIDCILNVAKANLLKEDDLKIYLLQELKKTFTSIQTYKKKLKNFNFDAFETDIQSFLDNEIERIEKNKK
ncbi:MAG: hypothetical protein U0T31_00645 [Chitinophagales bacterium]